MAQENLQFNCLEDSFVGILLPEEVRLFYYDIGFDSEVNHSVSYCWDYDMDAFCLRNNLLIDECKKGFLPQTVSENKVFLSLCEKEDKAMAFLRHLRNAFAHYRICSTGNYYCMKDVDKGKTTMIGKIDKNLFHELIGFYFKQKALAEEQCIENIFPKL